MKIIRSKGFLQKTIIVLIILILFNFIFPYYSSAKWWGGGTLFTPISELVCGIGDACLEILQHYLLPGSPEAVEYMSICAWMANENIENGATFTGTLQGVADTLANKSWILGDAIVAIDNWIVNTFTDMPEDSLANFYEEKVITAILYSPYAIFSNKIPALDVNFINPTAYYYGGKTTVNLKYSSDDTPYLETTYTEIKGKGTDDQKFKDNTAYQLRNTIATWYVALRNIAIVGLLSVLVYVAIRIIMSSTAGETAKYKSMLRDWLVAMCILFFMHYMMAFLLKSSEMLIDLFDNSKVSSGAGVNLESDKLMTESREMAQSAKDEEGEGDAGRQFGYTLIYCILVFYTVIFTWKYLKRFVYLAFLTMISPLVALTYPIDKLKDGSAQAFNMWFREYVFNVLIQPIHLLLYTILITSAMDFAQQNMIYSIVAIGFLLEAEKIVKSMFGFNKAQGGELSSAITGGAIFGTVAGLMKGGASMLPGGSKEKGGSGGGSSGGGKVHFNNRQANSGATNNLAAFTSGSAGGGATGGGAGSGTGSRGTGSRGTGPRGSGPRGSGTRGSGGSGRRIGGAALGGLKRGAGAVARFPVRTIKGVASAGGRFVNKDNAKKVAKLAAMGVGAATLGTVGLAAGIASDNDGDVLKYAGLGAATGGFIGNATYGLASATKSGASEVKDSFQQGFYGDEYFDKILNPRLDKEWQNDKDVQMHFKQKYGNQYKERMKDALELRKAGIVDQSEIDTAINLMKNNSGLTTDQAANIMQFTKGLSKSDLLNNDTRKNISKNAYKLVGNNSAAANQVMNLVDQRFKLK